MQPGFVYSQTANGVWLSTIWVTMIYNCMFIVELETFTI